MKWEAGFAVLTLTVSVLYFLIVWVFLGYDINLPFTRRSALAPLKIDIRFLILALLIAPITEELIFRGPIIAFKKKSKKLVGAVTGAVIFYEAFTFPDLFVMIFIFIPWISFAIGLLKLKEHKNYWKIAAAISLLSWPIGHSYELFATLCLFSLGGFLMFTDLRQKSIVPSICLHFIGNLSAIIIRTYLIH